MMKWPFQQFFNFRIMSLSLVEFKAAINVGLITNHQPNDSNSLGNVAMVINDPIMEVKVKF